MYSVLDGFPECHSSLLHDHVRHGCLVRLVIWRFQVRVRATALFRHVISWVRNYSYCSSQLSFNRVPAYSVIWGNGGNSRLCLVEGDTVWCHWHASFPSDEVFTLTAIHALSVHHTKIQLCHVFVNTLSPRLFGLPRPLLFTLSTTHEPRFCMPIPNHQALYIQTISIYHA
jgi:hypothetical protein